jgi:hypothetical protein
MFRLQACATIRNILDRIERIDVRDDSLDFFGVVSEFFEHRPHRLVDDFQHPAAGEQFVFHQRDIRLDPGRVAIHQKTDRAGRREHRHLRIAITVALAQIRRALPHFCGLFFQETKFLVIGNLAHGRAMQIDHFAHGGDIIFRDRFRHSAATGVAITRKRSHRSCRSCALLVGFASHDRGDRPAKRATFHTIVAVAVAHDERTEIGITKAERAEDV